MHPKTIELQDRTRRFAAEVIAFCGGLSQNVACQRIVPQLIDSSGSTDSNYRAACRARSKAEFIAKLGVAIEEADESKGWLQLLVESKQTTPERALPLIQEADELLSILIRSRKTAESRKAEEAQADKQSSQRRSR
ncbi:MAG TPA: four helix bundle protein [Vicinamibacterales bacterium]|jgi:four helix bundle protein